MPRHDTTDPNHNAHLTRTRQFEARAEPGDHVAEWGGKSGLHTVKMLMHIGRGGSAWSQQPRTFQNHEHYPAEHTEDLAIIPNLTWVREDAIQMPTHACRVLIIDWVPHGGDLRVLEALEQYTYLPGVEHIMTEQRTAELEQWFRRHGFTRGEDSQTYHEWWDRTNIKYRLTPHTDWWDRNNTR